MAEAGEEKAGNRIHKLAEPGKIAKNFAALRNILQKKLNKVAGATNEGGGRFSSPLPPCKATIGHRNVVPTSTLN